MKTCCYCGSYVGFRKRVSPTGRKNFAILCDSCHNCGAARPVSDLSWSEKHWLKRLNRKAVNYWLQSAEIALEQKELLRYI